MGNQIRVSTSKMSRDVKTLEQQIAVLPQVIGELKTQMHLLASCWEGPAWRTFQNQVADDIAFMSEVYQFLSAYNRALQSSAEGYLSAEQDNYSEIWKLWI